MEPYRHTQIGWVMIGVMAPIVAFMLFVVGPLGAALIAPLLLALLLFGTLTITVDGESVRFAFGVGLIRRRFPLASITTWRQVRNQWWHGWGIRFVPGGMLYNVSGLDAVELLLADGRRVRLGTDEPSELDRALRSRRGTPPPFDASLAQAPAQRRRWLLVVIGVVVLSLGAVLYGMVSHQQPPDVSVSPSEIAISSGWYSARIPRADITRLSLEPSIPRVIGRPNGFAMGSTLRGHFVVENLGRGRLFVNLGTPPYVLIHTADSYVIVNFDDAQRTRALFEELQPDSVK